MDSAKSEQANKNDDDTNEGTISGSDGEPKNKVAKLNAVEAETTLNLTLNPAYTALEFTQKLKSYWTAQQSKDIKDTATNVEVYGSPFQISLLPDLLHHKDSCKELLNEIVSKVYWSRKQMDLYEFYQSSDLSNMTECKLLTKFLQLLRKNVRPWLEKVTNLKLDYVSASCSMYTCGDYLLVHDDLLKDRQIAFVYYLSPWSGVEQWTEEHGGCLEIFDSDSQGFPQFPVKRRISPKNNQFAFFKVGARSFHQVGEVKTFDYPRITINGWFHGASNEESSTDNIRPVHKLQFKPAQEHTSILEPFLNDIYLRPVTIKNIQERIEDNSEICLYVFLEQDFFRSILNQLINDRKLKWRRQGPANVQNYETLDLSRVNGCVGELIKLFSSTDMFALLHEYTNLDLAGPAANAPGFSLELQRWTHGNYTVLGDGVMCDGNTLDLIYYLNAAEGAGVITYLSLEEETTSETSSEHNADKENYKDDESVLLTITPQDNSLNIVYRSDATTKFTKYVSHNTPLEKGPVFALCCSYKE